MSFVIFVLAYLLGSIPFGLLLTRLAGLGDIREIGSGNIGATNVLRTGRRDLAVGTLALDSGKGAIAVAFAHLATDGREIAMGMAAAGAFLGHCYPIYLRFKGGKGVATFLGTILALGWQVGLVACAIWLAVAGVTRYSSLSALVMAAVTPFLFLVFGDLAFFAASAFMTALIYVRHRPNIIRLLDRTETKIGQKG